MRPPLRVPLEPLVAGEILLDEAASRYVGRVHRRGPGDPLLVFDPGARLEADATVLDEGRRVRLRVGEPRPTPRVVPYALTLLQAIGKADKVDQVVRDATALGARRVVVIQTERCVASLQGREGARRARWRGVAVQAARQCGRGDLPELSGPLSIEAALALLAPTEPLGLCLDPGGLPFTAALARWERHRPLALAIGPEGGLTASERALLLAHGFVLARLGRFTLRTETAATVALGTVSALFEGA